MVEKKGIKESLNYCFRSFYYTYRPASLEKQKQIANQFNYYLPNKKQTKYIILYTGLCGVFSPAPFMEMNSQNADF